MFFDSPREKMIHCCKCGKPMKVIIGDDITVFTRKYCGKCEDERRQLYDKIMVRLEREYKGHLIQCYNCGGTGNIKGYNCVECKGKGRIKDQYLDLNSKASKELSDMGY